MDTQLKSPDTDYQQAMLVVRLGPLLPCGKLGWVKRMEKRRELTDRPAYRFVSATNHDLVFVVFEGEFELIDTV